MWMFLRHENVNANVTCLQAVPSNNAGCNGSGRNLCTRSSLVCFQQLYSCWVFCWRGEWVEVYIAFARKTHAVSSCLWMTLWLWKYCFLPKASVQKKVKVLLLFVPAGEKHQETLCATLIKIIIYANVMTLDTLVLVLSPNTFLEGCKYGSTQNILNKCMLQALEYYILWPHSASRYKTV